MNDECPFCQIIARKREADIVYEDGTLVAFKDMYPHAPIHLLIVPKKHIRSINDLTPEDKDIVAGMLIRPLKSQSKCRWPGQATSYS